MTTKIEEQLRTTQFQAEKLTAEALQWRAAETSENSELVDEFADNVVELLGLTVEFERLYAWMVTGRIDPLHATIHARYLGARGVEILASIQECGNMLVIFCTSSVGEA